MFIRKIIFKIAVKCRASDKTLKLISPSLYGIRASNLMAEGFAKGFITHKANYSNENEIEIWEIDLKD